MSSSTRQTCAGCLRTFSSQRGLSSHLRQTTSERCKAILQAIEDPGIDDQPEAQSNADHNTEDAPEVFGGDFFGSDYEPMDFPGWINQTSEDEDDEDNELTAR